MGGGGKNELIEHWYAEADALHFKEEGGVVRLNIQDKILTLDFLLPKPRIFVSQLQLD